MIDMQLAQKGILRVRLITKEFKLISAEALNIEE